MEKDRFVVFGDNQVRRVWHNGEWFFSVVDVVGVLSGSVDAKDYWYRLKVREQESSGIELSTFCRQLKIIAGDGKMRETDCANKEALFRLIQSIPSKRAESFKLWLAKVGSERIDEIENPELSIDRAMKTYLVKGYSEKWINQRLKTIEVRKELTDEWRRSGVDEGKEFAILTNDLTEAWSGKSVGEYKDFKGLSVENLRDNMTNLELVLNMLAEATTAEISKKESPDGFDESRGVAVRGGGVAGVARQKIEKELGREVVSRKKARDLIREKKKKMLIMVE